MDAHFYTFYTFQGSFINAATSPFQDQKIIFKNTWSKQGQRHLVLRGKQYRQCNESI